MKKIRTVVVDDERRARALLKQMLGEFPRIELCGEADHADAAEQLIAEQQPDLAFLDVQMPTRSGFDLLDHLVNPPHVIFVTAYDNFAVHAFEVNAVDYLLKPVLPERLRKSVERVEALLDTPACTTEPMDDEQVVRLSGSDLIKLQFDHALLMRPVQSLIMIQAEGDYSRVFLAERNELINRTMNAWEQLLPTPLFVRLDRSLIVNMQAVDVLKHHSRSKGQLHMHHLPNPVPLGRTALKRLRALLRK